MKKWALLAAAALATAFMAGCEWTAGSTTSTWNESANWADFSGVYRASGAIMVSEFGTSGGWTNTVGSTNAARELLDTGDGSTTMFDSRLENLPMPGSVTFVAGAYVFTDDEGNSPDGTADLNVNIPDGTEGTINYATGQYTVRFSYPLALGTKLYGTYTYTSSDSSDSGNAQGNHGSPIYSFTVYQQGSTLILIDSNGNRYDGELGTVRVTGGNPPTDPITDENSTAQNGPVVAQFTATGTANGYRITIVGTLQGTRTDTTFANRTITGTYMEEGGFQADLNGNATAVYISTSGGGGTVTP